MKNSSKLRQIEEKFGIDKAVELALYIIDDVSCRKYINKENHLDPEFTEELTLDEHLYNERLAIAFQKISEANEATVQALRIKEIKQYYFEHLKKLSETTRIGELLEVFSSCFENVEKQGYHRLERIKMEFESGKLDEDRFLALVIDWTYNRLDLANSLLKREYKDRWENEETKAEIDSFNLTRDLQNEQVEASEYEKPCPACEMAPCMCSDPVR